MKNGLALCAIVLFLLSLAFGQSSALPLTQRIALPNVDGRMDHMGIDIVLTTYTGRCPGLASGAQAHLHASSFNNRPF